MNTSNFHRFQKPLVGTWLKLRFTGFQLKIFSEGQQAYITFKRHLWLIANYVIFTEMSPPKNQPTKYVNKIPAEKNNDFPVNITLRYLPHLLKILLCCPQSFWKVFKLHVFNHEYFFDSLIFQLLNFPF